MATNPRVVPRFLPTLTEVVHVTLPRPTPASPVGLDAAAVDPVTITESVRVQLDAEIGELLRDAVATAMLEQVDAISARLQEQIEPVLRQAVEDMVAQEIASRRHS